MMSPNPLRPALYSLLLGGLFFLQPAYAEIYKWVDAQGRVHFSDKRHADERAKLLDDDKSASVKDNQLILFPEADALLGRRQIQPQGHTPILSAGLWAATGVTQKYQSILRFDLTELIKVINNNPEKKLYRATLKLSANTDDKLYGQGSANNETPGHSTLSGDNAFYLKPVHNSWSEDSVTWANFYTENNYTPSMIRNLPAISVDGSDGDAKKDFAIDVLPLFKQIAKSNINTLTLEISLQRKVKMAEVTFFSREAAAEKRPTLIIEFFDSGLNAAPATR